LIDFKFPQGAYFPPNGEAVDFQFSADKVIAVTSNLTINVYENYLQGFSLSVQSKVEVSTTVRITRPIQLRFNTPWLNATSPITLRFGDEQVPEQPDPIRVGTIGMVCGVVFNTSQIIEQQLTLSQRSQSHAANTVFAWDSFSSLKQQIVMVWNTPPLAGEIFAVDWQWNTLVPFQLDMNWLVPEAPCQQAISNWIVPELQQTMLEMQWSQAAAKSQQIIVKLHIGEQLATEIALSYTNIQGQGDNKTVAWAPHAARWVCSSKYVPPVGKVTLRFSEPWINSTSPIQLRFTASPNVCYWDDGGGLIDANPPLPNIDFKIPIEPQIRRYYLMQPTLSCVRAADGQVIVITSVSISDARGQYTQGVSIEFGSAIDASRAHNQLLLISINGYEFFAIAEQVNKSSSFGTENFTANGRSKTALLAAPWMGAVSYTNTVAKSFAGLLSDILANSGWSLELIGIPDFVVPKGAYSAIADSPLDLLNDAVSQLNCMIIADEANQVVKVYPRWPTVPWEFSSSVADVNIHDAVILTYNSQEEINQPCNVVWLRGEQNGVSARVKRTGTAGDIAAQDIAASLIVDAQAARVAGTMVLADTGNKEIVSVTLPIMNDLPPLQKGMLIGVTYRGEVYKAICDNVSISATVDPSAGIDIYQSVKLIRHI